MPQRIWIIPIVITLGLPIARETDAASAWMAPSLAVEERFDDNIFSTEENREDDFVTAIAPALALSREAARLASRARYRLRFELFSKHPELNRASPNHDLDAAVSLKWGRGAKVEWFEHFSYTPEQPEFIGEGGVGNVLGEGIRTRRSDSLRNVATIRLRQPVTAKTILNTQYQHGISRYEDVTLVDSMRHEVSAGMAYEIAPWSIPFLEYRYHGISYDGGENARIHNVRVGYLRRISPIASIDLAAGAAFPRQAGDQAPQFVSELGFNRALKTWGWRARYIRQIGTSGGFVRELSTSDRASVTLSRKVLQSLTASVTGNYAKNRSITATAEPLAIDSYALQINASYPLNPWLLMNFGYSHFRQDPDGPLGARIVRNQALVSLTAARRDAETE
jgi:hypothetical protein